MLKIFSAIKWEEYGKALAAFIAAFLFQYLSGLAVLLAIPGATFTISLFMKPLMLSLAGGITAGLAAWKIPNKLGGKNVFELAKDTKTLPVPKPTAIVVNESPIKKDKYLD